MAIRYSVIIPTLNGARRIITVLHSLLRQSISPEQFEIIVVDDGSTDNTQEMVRTIHLHNPRRNIIYYRQQNLGPAAARNAGILKARGSILFFTDDDCEVPALWLEKMLDIYKKYPEVACVQGWYQPPLRTLHKNIYEQFIYLRYRSMVQLDFFDQKMEQKKKEGATLFPSLNTANVSIKKWVFDIVGNFDTRYFPQGLEDFELGERIQRHKLIAYYIPLHVLHHKNLNFRTALRTCLNRGRGWRVYRKTTAGQLTHRRLTSAWNTTKILKAYCDGLEKNYRNFRYKRSILLVSFLWQLLTNFMIRVPFF